MEIQFKGSFNTINLDKFLKLAEIADIRKFSARWKDDIIELLRALTDIKQQYAEKIRYEVHANGEIFETHDIEEAIDMVERAKNLRKVFFGYYSKCIAHDEDPSAETDGECACGWTSIVIEYSR